MVVVPLEAELCLVFEKILCTRKMLSPSLLDRPIFRRPAPRRLLPRSFVSFPPAPVGMPKTAGGGRGSATPEAAEIVTVIFKINNIPRSGCSRPLAV